MRARLRHLVDRIALVPRSIPRGRQVDPAAFPEDDYPVVCLRCGYLLRGLPDGQCPECGEAFARGHLLVEEYVRLRRPRTDLRHRWAGRLTNVGLVVGCLPAAIVCGLYFAAWGAPERFLSLLHKCLQMDKAAFRWLPRVLLLLFVLAMTAQSVGLYLYRTTLPMRAKRRAVYRAASRQERAAR